MSMIVLKGNVADIASKKGPRFFLHLVRREVDTCVTVGERSIALAVLRLVDADGSLTQPGGVAVSFMDFLELRENIEHC